MKRILWVVVPVVIVIIVYTSIGNDSTDIYSSTVLETIESRKNYLQFNESSPFNQYNVEYTPPKYFPIDPSFKVNATVEKIDKRDMVLIQNSDGKKESYLKYAWLSFKLKEKELKLLVLKPSGFGAIDETLLCAFADESSGTSTYGAGRYIDIEIGKTDKVVLDFNLAYNPYCAYVDGYTCPLPPPENILPIGIEAGEMDFKSGI